MPVCESCRLDNPPGRDFCAECGYYLRWEPTVPQPAVVPNGAPKPVPTQRQPAVARASSRPRKRHRRDPRGGVVIALARDTVDLTVDAGGEVRIGALVRNRGELVDHYVIEVGGVPADWWTAEPCEIHLVPYGRPGEYEQHVDVILRPPRSPRARAGRRPITVRAVPQSTAARPGEATTDLTIRPFGACSAQLEPETVAGRRRGRFRMRVTNDGNAPLTATPSASDGEDACHTGFTPERLELGPGEMAVIALTVRPRRQIWLGRPRLHQLTAGVAGEDAIALRGAFRQRPWLPWWLAVAGPIVVAGAVLAFALWPRTAIVPDLSRARSAFEAQRMLQEAGLTLDPTQRGEPSANAAPGSVLKQSLAPGTEVRRGTAVALLLALGLDRHAVPDVVGLTLPEADKLLAGHFKLGKWQPDDAPDTAVIRSQWPAAGEERQDGTPINVSLEPGTAPAPAVIPSLEPSATATPTATPIAGQALAYDDGTDLFHARPGETPAALSTDKRATEPTWTADGKSLVYMRWSRKRGRIWSFEPGGYPGSP